MATIRKAFLIGVVSSFTLAGCVSSNDWNLNVSANKTASAASYIYNRSNCHIQPPAKVTIMEQPAHGTLRVRQERRKLDGKCSGRTAIANVFYYTPNRGYRGKDQAVIRETFPKLANRSSGPRNVTSTMNITVQ